MKQDQKLPLKKADNVKTSINHIKFKTGKSSAVFLGKISDPHEEEMPH